MTQPLFHHSIRPLSLLFLTLLSVSPAGATAIQLRPTISLPTADTGNTHTRILLVYTDDAIGDAPLRETARKLKADIIYEYKYAHALALNFSQSKKKTEAIVKRLMKTKGVIKVMEDRTIHTRQQPAR